MDSWRSVIIKWRIILKSQNTDRVVHSAPLDRISSKTQVHVLWRKSITCSESRLLRASIEVLNATDKGGGKREIFETSKNTIHNHKHERTHTRTQSACLFYHFHTFIRLIIAYYGQESYQEVSSKSTTALPTHVKLLLGCCNNNCRDDDEGRNNLINMLPRFRLLPLLTAAWTPTNSSKDTFNRSKRCGFYLHNLL